MGCGSSKVVQVVETVERCGSAAVWEGRHIDQHTKINACNSVLSFLTDAFVFLLD